MTNINRMTAGSTGIAPVAFRRRPNCSIARVLGGCVARLPSAPIHGLSVPPKHDTKGRNTKERIVGLPEPCLPSRPHGLHPCNWHRSNWWTFKMLLIEETCNLKVANSPCGGGVVTRRRSRCPRSKKRRAWFGRHSCPTDEV